MLRRLSKPLKLGQPNLTPVSVCGMFGSAKAIGGSEIPLQSTGEQRSGMPAPDGISPSGARFPESFARLSACRDSGDIATELREPHR